ncbi:MAG TPA: DUF1330 domain-containing protein [Alphaproteobacteria bacterium]|jgi:uncharacterized protein (DUF1330 family)|nr:DUF1330 domain-containing protein [Alphaproteobacteria bacterium]|tara:strand:+ start:221 stop:511 length:291 start_codon:yes stop_codon:yes gene_type:complete
MKVYLIAHIEVTNPELMEKYRELVPKIVAKYQGKYLVRGGDSEILEGDYFKHRIVLLEFPSRQQANNFYNSEDYAPLKMLRIEAGNNSSVLVEGIE